MEDEKQLGTTPAETPQGEEAPPPKTYTEDEYKGLQRLVNKLQQDLQQSKATTSEIKSIKDDLTDLRELIAITRSGEQENVVTGTETVSDITARIRELESKRQIRIADESQQREQTVAAWNEILELTSEAEITSTDDGLGKARELWTAGKIQDAVREARKAAINILKSKASVTQKVAAEEEAEKEKLHKLAKVETGGPTAGKVSFEDARKAYADGEISREQYEEAARRAGKNI